MSIKSITVGFTSLIPLLLVLISVVTGELSYCIIGIIITGLYRYIRSKVKYPRGYPLYSLVGVVSLAMIITGLIRNDVLYMVYASILTLILHF